MICGIYKIVNKINGKCYIGQSINIEARFKQHIRSTRYKNKVNKLYNALRKYGVENFVFSVICEVPQSSLNEYEISYIKYYNSFTNGYNSTSGGDYYCYEGISKSNRLQSFRDKTSKAQKKLLADPEIYNKRCEQLNSILPRKEINYEGVFYSSLIEFAITKSLELGIKPATIISRYNKGQNIETNIKEENKKIEYAGTTYLNIQILANNFNLSINCVRKRIRTGKPLEEKIRKDWYLYGCALYTITELSEILNIEVRSVRRRIKNQEYIHTPLKKPNE